MGCNCGKNKPVIKPIENGNNAESGTVEENSDGTTKDKK
jgi:hypothetical protein